MRSLALAAICGLVPSCVFHVHVHEAPREAQLAAGAPQAGSHAEPGPSEQVPNTVSGVVLDADGKPAEARVALVSSGGSFSTWTDPEGRFDLEAFAERSELAVHASTTDGRVAVQRVPARGEPLRLVLQPGATLTVDLAATEDARCAIFRGDVRLEDFTLRAGESSRVVVPPGPIRVRLYQGDRIRVERETVVAQGETPSMRFELGA